MAEPILDDPKYIDLALDEINTKLKEQFSWLNNAFGLAERKFMFRSNPNDPRFNAHDTYPAIFKGGDQENYLSLLPNTDYGNFSFWDIEEDREEISKESRFIKRKVGIVFWFDYRDIYTDWEQKSINNVKYDLVENFFGFMYFSKSVVSIYSINERSENIYKTYYHKEINSQFLMRPYGGLRINMEIMINKTDSC